MTTLIIDTANNRPITVGVKINGEDFKSTENITSRSSRIVLSMIDSILRKHKIRLRDIDGILVNTGPGSFTGLRAGIAIANALSYTLKVPVNGKKLGAKITPKY
ncbi:MAG: tRNA (adenosine(37)-N6)-threonylcarbamoyltransferase complex dimerization subunit type 1 TsaB [Candidatus Levybacteria bacterium]|nr:tRNA (adenosine(37)-N6)-threonylcarbamoyltransferase complex dimerization subunit type 1 TsaB [Candidatus Levybacteria bacterium]